LNQAKVMVLRAPDPSVIGGRPPFNRFGALAVSKKQTWPAGAHAGAAAALARAAPNLSRAYLPRNTPLSYDVGRSR